MGSTMNRDNILEAAAQIFTQKGFHAASMQDIAQAVQLQKASLYYHVNSKQEILFEILDRALDLVSERMQSVLLLPISPQEKLSEAVHVYLNTLTEYHNLASVLLLEYRSLEPEFRSRHIEKRDCYEQLWRDLIQTGLEAGKYKTRDAAVCTRAILGAMNQVVLWYRPDGRFSASEIGDIFSDVFINGLLTRE